MFSLRMISIKDVINLTVFGTLGTLETSLYYMLFLINQDNIFKTQTKCRYAGGTKKIIQ